MELIEVAGSQVSLPCETSNLAVGQTFNGFAPARTELLSPSGEVFITDSAHPSAQDDLTLQGLTAAPEVEHFADWSAPPVPGTVVAASRLGGRAEIRVVGPEDISSVRFEVSIGRVKSSPSPIEAGGTYGYDDLVFQSEAPSRTLHPRVLQLQTSGQALCSEVPSAWFQLSSRTPEVCELFEFPEPSDATSSGNLPINFRLRQNGACILDVEAPRLPANLGFPVQWQATFTEVERHWGW